MKDKKSTILLVLAVALVWGFAVYQFVAGFGGGDETYEMEYRASVPAPMVMIEDSFALQLDYRDPFLGKVYYSSPRPMVKKQVRQNKQQLEKAVPEVKVDLSFIKYIGLIFNQKSGKEVSLLSIQGKDYFMMEGQSVQDVLLLENLEDSVHIEYKGQKYFIKR